MIQNVADKEELLAFCELHQKKDNFGCVKGPTSSPGPSAFEAPVTESRKFHAWSWLMRFYNNRLLANNLRLLASKFELDPSQRKSAQVDASGWPNETQVEHKSKTCVDLRVRLARA